MTGKPEPSIAFIHPGKAYLPELHAYQEYFSERGFEIAIYNQKVPEDIAGFLIHWYLMGTNLKKGEGVITVHEYNSLPVSAAGLKVAAKKLINAQPDLRVFLNDAVQDKYNFHDDVPAVLRDMGVHHSFFKVTNNSANVYDFVYCGEMKGHRNIGKLIEHFKTEFKESTLLLIGTLPENLQSKVKRASNISSTGRVNYGEIPGLLSQCEYGINYMPNRYPYNIQTSTKLLEYCAVGLKILTTDYQWVNTFEAENRARFYKVSEDLSDLTLDKLNTFAFETPNVERYQWNNILEQSGLESAVNHLIARVQLDANSKS